MKVASRPLKYLTQPSRSKLLAGKPRYIGRVHHNQTLSREEIVKGLAEYMNVKEPMSAFYVDGLCGFMRQELARGGGWKGLMPVETEVEDRQMLLNFDLTG